jgi:hypothetical protein
MSKTLPYFLTTVHGRISSDEHVRPLPPLLMRLLADTSEGQQHADLARRYSELRTRTSGIASSLEKQRRADATAEREALATSKRVPKPKAPQIELELEDAHRQLQTFEDLLAESARALLDASIGVLAEADEQASCAIERALADARAAMQAAEASLTEAGELAAEAAWVEALKLDGTIHPWRAGRAAQPAPTAYNALKQALGAFEHDLQRAAEMRERLERERAHELASLAPGTQVWDGGRTLVVREDGTLEQVQR